MNHEPPSTWKCYSAAGHDGAGHSNLAIGVNCAAAIALYMDDRAVPTLGHRRWILHAPTTFMGSGSIGNTNALYVVNSEVNDPAPAGTPEYLAWPAEGYSPWQLRPRDQWSLSTTRGPDMSQATVRVWKNGVEQQVVTNHLALGRGPNSVGFSFPQDYTGGAADQPYQITVSGIRAANGSPQPDYTYVTTLFDPDYVPPSAQSITFPQPPGSTYGGTASLTASASSGLPVGLATTTPAVCTISGTTVSAIGVGTCTSVASQGGNAQWLAAPTVSRSLAIGKATLRITGNGTAYAGDIGTIPPSYTGFVRNENLSTSDVRGAPTCAAPVDDTSPSGSYPVTCSLTGLTSAHYAFTAVQGSLRLQAGLIAVTPTRLVDTAPGSGWPRGGFPAAAR